MAVGRRLSGIDLAMAHLVRLVFDQDWSAATAAVQLREFVGDDARVLDHLRIRVETAAADRASDVADRALATLEAASAGGADG